MEVIKLVVVWLGGGIIVSLLFGGSCLLIGKAYDYVINRTKKQEFVTPINLKSSPNALPIKQPLEPLKPIIQQFEPLLQKYQAELDAWLEQNFNGNSRQRGQLYERYVGYRWEIEHYKVEYIGIYKNNHGKGDGGIDLICHDEKYTWILQCKNYQNNISPAQVQQHSGVVQIYAQAHPDEIVGGAFFATSSFSAQSKQDAEKLGIELFENEKLIIPFPVIKCKILSNKKLFFLPTDADYDNLEIEIKNGDFYCLTVLEAAEKGFTYGGTSQVTINYEELYDKYESIDKELTSPKKVSKKDMITRLKNVQDRHTLEFDQAEKLRRIENVEKIS